MDRFNWGPARGAGPSFGPRVGFVEPGPICPVTKPGSECPVRRTGLMWDHLTLRKASMKKLTAILLTLCVSMAVVGCGEGEKTGGKSGTTPPVTKPADKK